LSRVQFLYFFNPRQIIPGRCAGSHQERAVVKTLTNKMRGITLCVVYLLKQKNT